MNKFKHKILIGTLVGLLMASATACAFNEIEDLSKTGTLGNKEVFVTPDKQSEQITILGEAEATQEQMIAYINLHSPQPKLNCTVEEIVRYYYEEAAVEGIRPDVALCQAIKETGFFNYGGDVDPKQNNFCGLGATGNGAKGYSFVSPRRGVRAHIQHLAAYATKEELHNPLVDPRYEVLVTRYPQYHGAIQYWTGLNGRWAVPGTNYGQDILHLWREALNM